MHRNSFFTSFNSLEHLELKLSPTALAGAPLTSVVATLAASDDSDADANKVDATVDPLPNPEPPPPPDPGNNPPVGYPGLPSSGPAGPGS